MKVPLRTEEREMGISITKGQKKDVSGQKSARRCFLITESSVNCLEARVRSG